MKKFIILIVVLVVIVLGVIVYPLLFSSAANKDLYSEATKITYDQVYDDKEGTNYYYYYQTSCHFCNQIKPTTNEFYQFEKGTDDDMYIIDVADTTNKNAWTSETLPTDKNELIEYQKKRDFPTIAGTPGLVVTENGVITGYYTGAEQIPNFMNGIMGK